MQKKYTKNIHLYPINNKFNKNILNINHIDDILISTIPTNYNIFQYYYSNNNLQTNNIKNIFIFNASILNDEIKTFILNFNKSISFWILIDTMIDKTDNLPVKYIYENEIYSDGKKLHKNTISKALYANTIIPDKQDQIVYFFDNSKPVLEKELNTIKKYLYPSTNLKIKLFDNNKFQHYQNLGFLSESDKKQILLESKYYLHNGSDYYITEASMCECLLVDLYKDDISNIIGNKNQNTINTNSIYYYEDLIKEISDE